MNDPSAESLPMRIGLWGLGRHAFQSVLPALAASPHVRLVGVCSRNAAAVKNACTDFGCGSWPDERAMLADDRIDLVYLATPTGVHFEQALRVLEAGKHLLCEKSLTNSAPQSLALVTKARELRLLLCEAFMFFYHPRWLELTNLISQPDFGDIRSLVCNFYLPTLENPGFRHDPLLGGGAFWDVGCYVVAAALAAGPRPWSVEVAEIRRAPGSAVDTSGATVLRFADQALGYLSWGYDCAYKNEISIVGSKQSVYLEHVFSKEAPPASLFQRFDRNGGGTNIACDSQNAMLAMLARVREALASSDEMERMRLQARHQAETMHAVLGRVSGQPALFPCPTNNPVI
jgi:NDP-hexose-3-ketoreductase